MKIVMIGEAATHQDEIASALPFAADFISLPREAHESPQWDAQINGADVLVAMRFQRSTPAPRFRLLHVPGAGLDGIDFSILPSACTVCNVFEHEIPMAEYTLAAMLDYEVCLSALSSRFVSGGWSDTYLSRIPRGELYGKTVLIIGFGRIGQAIALRARAFGMKVIAISRSGEPHELANASFTANELLHHLPLADYVVLCCPLNEQTRGSFAAAQFAAMRQDAVFINIARGPIVEQQALYQALETNQIARAYLDVWYNYPSGSDDEVHPADLKFELLPNAVCTPHISGWTHGLFARRYHFIADNIQRLQNNQPLKNVVFEG